jgi:GxxExxY protein
MDKVQGITETQKRANTLSNQIIAAAIEVHRALGPGLLESAYESCMCQELGLKNISFKRQVPLSIEYKGLKLECAYRIDLLVENLVVVELKAVDSLLPIHEAQLLTYLKLTNIWLGMLINFDIPLVKDGVKRIVNGAGN